MEEDFVLETEKEKFVEELKAIMKKAHEILQIHSMVCLDSQLLLWNVYPLLSFFLELILFLFLFHFFLDWIN